MIGPPSSLFCRPFSLKVPCLLCLFLPMLSDLLLKILLFPLFLSLHLSYKQDADFWVNLQKHNMPVRRHKKTELSDPESSYWESSQGKKTRSFSHNLNFLHLWCSCLISSKKISLLVWAKVFWQASRGQQRVMNSFFWPSSCKCLLVNHDSEWPDSLENGVELEKWVKY